jgi:hypothetical protein
MPVGTSSVLTGSGISYGGGTHLGELGELSGRRTCPSWMRPFLNYCVEAIYVAEIELHAAEPSWAVAVGWPGASGVDRPPLEGGAEEGWSIELLRGYLIYNYNFNIICTYKTKLV